MTNPAVTAGHQRYLFVSLFVIRYSSFDRSALCDDEVVNQAAGDADARRDVGEFIDAEPVGSSELARVDGDLARSPLRAEAEHQRVREGPGLAAEILDVGDLDPHLLADLAAHRRLQRLPRLDEAGQD